MDASYKIQRGIHVHLIQFFMCPEFWVHISFHTLCAACFVLISCFQLRHRNKLTGVAEIPVHFVALEVADDLTLVVAHGHKKSPHTDAFKIDFKTSIFSSLNSIILSPHTPRPGE